MNKRTVLSQLGCCSCSNTLETGTPLFPCYIHLKAVTYNPLEPTHKGIKCIKCSAKVCCLGTTFAAVKPKEFKGCLSFFYGTDISTNCLAGGRVT